MCDSRLHSRTTQVSLTTELKLSFDIPLSPVRWRFHAPIYMAERRWVRRELAFRLVTSSTFQAGRTSEEPIGPNTIGYSIDVRGLIQPAHKTNNPEETGSFLKSRIKQRAQNSLHYKAMKTGERKLSQLEGNRGCPSAKVQPRQITPFAAEWASSSVFSLEVAIC